MSEVSPEIVAKTQKSLGKYVKKPALNEKLLKKPPFRFLHDVIKVVIKETGFLNGLFSEDELNSENVKEKEAKVAFLTKLIDAVKVVSKTELKVRSSKIVAGLEPIETNILLQTIAKSIDKKIDTSQYVASLNSGNKVIKEKSRRKSIEGNKEEKEKKENSKERIKRESKPRDASVNRIKKSGSVETPVSTDRAKESSRLKIKEDKKEKTSKSKQKTETSNRKEGKHKGDGDKAKEKDEQRKIKDTEKEVSKENEKNRAGSNIDTGNAIVNESKETINNIDDVTNDKNVLHSAQNIDKEDAEVNGATVPEKTKPTANLENSEKPDEKTMVSFSNPRQGSAGLVRPKSARPKSGDRIMSSRGRNDGQEIEGKKGVEIEKQAKELKGTIEMKAPLPRPPSVRPSSSLRPPSVRPSSARPGAPRLRPESALPVAESVVMGNINVIVENFDSGLGDEEETVVIQNAPEVAEEEEMATSDLLNISGENKGQLVEQILEQIQEGQDGIRKKVEIDWEQDGLRGKDATTKEVTQLRSFIQSLTKTANPLGKLMNYLHEDLDAMHNELQMWTKTKKQLYMEIEKQKKSTIESSKPLLDKLDHLRQEIKKQEQEIVTVRSNILKNEQRIAELLETATVPEDIQEGCITFENPRGSVKGDARKTLPLKIINDF